MGSSVSPALAVLNPVTLASSIAGGKLGKEAGAEALGFNANREKAYEEEKKQKEAMAGLMDEAKKRKEKEESESELIRVRDEARARQRAATMGAQGRRSTILTGSLGLSGGSTGGGKQLLGQ